MAETNPVIEIALQNIRPVIEMVIEQSGLHDPQVQLVSVSDRKYYQSSSTVIIGAYAQVLFNFTSFVPRGYTCIGCREVSLTNVTGGGVAVGLASKNANITYQNITPNAIRPGERDQVGYYCTAKATLICVKNGVLSQ